MSGNATLPVDLLSLQLRNVKKHALFLVRAQRDGGDGKTRLIRAVVLHVNSITNSNNPAVNPEGIHDSAQRVSVVHHGVFSE